MATTVSKRQKAHAILASSKRDLSPKWDGAENWSQDQFNKNFREAMSWYNLNKSVKDLKPQIINWMAREGFDKKLIAQFKKTRDSRTGMTMCGLAACLMKGMPAVHPNFNNGKNSAEWLRNQILEVIDSGDFEEEEKDVKQEKHAAPVLNIQDRLREAAGGMSEELDYAIDNWITDPDNFDPKSFKILSLLRGKGAKAAHARYIKSFFQRGYDELMELSSGNADEQLREAYKHNSRKNVKKLIEFYELIMAACDQIAAEQKILKKPRAKKVKPAEDLVKKLKFKTSDDKLGIVSVPPAQIIGASTVLVYNVKTRKIGLYVSKDTSGFRVKGTTLENFTDKSTQKTLRKPVEQFKELKEQNTARRVESWYAKNIKTTETKLNGRFNEDTVILRVYK